jgi:excisionase family DNA binding protein
MGNNELLTVQEVATELRVDATTVRRWVKNNALEAVVLPHQNKRQAYRIKRSTFNALLTSTTLTTA